MMVFHTPPVLRFWEIDALRGVAILMMITFHTVYDLNYFGGAAFRINHGFWWVFARLTALLFIVLVGLSLTISYAKTSRRLSSGALHRKFVWRGLTLLAWGALISVMTWMAIPEGTIVFGVLHFIGVGIILAYPLIPHLRLQLGLGVACIAAGLLLQSVTVESSWLLWLGIRPTRFYTFDYFPLLPWLGVLCLGMSLGILLYPQGVRRWPLPEQGNQPVVRLLVLMGKRSLFIYLVHQPVLIAVLWVTGAITITI